jgi:cytochrome c553
MKKLLLLGVPAVVLVLVAIYGSDLVGLYRLQAFIAQWAASYEKEKGPWPNVADECEGCHGVKGNSLYQGYPALAGQPASYLSAQLNNFATGQRNDPTMGPLAMTLTPENIRVLSGYFAAQRVHENRSFRGNPELAERGGRIVANGGCPACHGLGLTGANQFPRLAGQGYDYLLKQLDNFAAGTRRDPGNTMNQLASAWTPDDRQGIATFLATHPVSRAAR